MSLIQELNYLEENLNEVDRLFLDQIQRSAQTGRYERISEFVHSAAARGWRVRLKALRAHPEYQRLIQGVSENRPLQYVPLAELVSFKGGLTQRTRSKAHLALPWYKISHFHVDAHLMQVKSLSDDLLQITPREEHGALNPYDLLLLTKGNHFGVYLRPYTSPLSAPKELGEVAHTSFIKLSIDHLKSPIIHPAYLAAFLTSADGILALTDLQKNKTYAQEDSLEWSLTISDLQNVPIPICSPFRQALMISAWALRVELQRQQKFFYDMSTRNEALRVSAMLPKNSKEISEHHHLADHDLFKEFLSNLTQPFDGDGPLRITPLHQAALFPTVGRHMILRALTRHLMSLSPHLNQDHWRALKIVTLGHPNLLKAHALNLGLTEEDAYLKNALNQQCVGICSAALTQLNRHLLVNDDALQLPRYRPEPWFYFTTPHEIRQPDLIFMFWGHHASKAPSLGEALRECSTYVEDSLDEEYSAQLSSILRISMDQHFVQTSFYAHTLGGDLDFTGWNIYLLIYQVTDEGFTFTPENPIYLSTLERLCPRTPPTQLVPSSEQRWDRSLKDLIDIFSPKYRFHLEHLSELKSQLLTLIPTPF